ncbi:zinc finger protein 831 [Gouania willdenowi]|uniref:C2H2-type domain-containing protein n=1 Tax=Gouania willdenowi TaxID=441366 RepID=A0A8C5HBN8_GOUWI|nr:zinc finger protein 831 [Gouania willdenowi]
MDVQAPLTAVYIHTLPALLAQPTPLRLSVQGLHHHSEGPPPSFTLHIPNGLQVQAGPSLVVSAPAAKTARSAGKHVCPHCGRDCMKPSVLEKHLRCHTGERPYPCATCKVSFKTQSNLYKHRRTQAHARLSYESEQSGQSSRETSFSEVSVDEQSDDVVPSTDDHTEVCARETKDSASQQKPSTNGNNNSEPKESKAPTKEEEKSEKSHLNVGQHPSLQRQEATLFSKHWESSSSRGKSQSHESTDSGFSESCDPSSSPSCVSSEQSIECVPECCTERLQSVQDAQTGEQRSLEERISQLISQNTAVVEDKHLEHVRPRKSVLSKQGSIDLPMPYTYKDSFHFEMRLGPNNVHTAGSSSNQHAPITRSHSLPFSMTLLQPDTPSHRSDYGTLIRRDDSVKQNSSSNHHPLVRQTAVDCNHSAEGGLCTNQSCASSLSCDGDSAEETNNKKFRRRKSQKFAYDKWYMYGGGTFKKLYNVEKVSDNKSKKSSPSPDLEAPNRLKVCPKAALQMVGSTDSRNSRTRVSHAIYHAASFPISNVKFPLQSRLSLPSIGLTLTDKPEGVTRTDPEIQTHEADPSQLDDGQVPSNRKKQKTDFQTSSVSLFPAPVVVASNPPQSSNVTYSNVFTPKDPRSQSSIHAHVQPVALPTTSPSSAAKNSFLPKYQLKIPNPTERVLNSSPCVAEQKTELVPLSRSSNPEECLPSICKSLNILNVTQTCVTSICQSHESNVSETSSGPGLLSGAFDGPSQFHQPVTSTSVVLTVTTANTEKPACAAVQAFPRPQSSSSSSSLHHSGHAVGTGAPLVPGAVALDLVQPAAQNVFHVQTADLQICFQIISDEQLALIEPQIESLTDCYQSRDFKDKDSGNLQNQPQDICVTTESSEVRVSHQQEEQESSFQTEEMTQVGPRGDQYLHTQISVMEGQRESEGNVTKAQEEQASTKTHSGMSCDPIRPRTPHSLSDLHPQVGSLSPTSSHQDQDQDQDQDQELKLSSITASHWSAAERPTGSCYVSDGSAELPAESQNVNNASAERSQNVSNASAEHPAGSVCNASLECPARSVSNTSAERLAGNVSNASTECPSGSVSDASSEHPSRNFCDASSKHPLGSVSDASSKHPSGSLSDASLERPAGSFYVSDASTERPAGSCYVRDASTERPSGSCYVSNASSEHLAGSCYVSDASTERPAESYYISDASTERPSGSYYISDASAERPAGSCCISDASSGHPAGNCYISDASSEHPAGNCYISDASSEHPAGSCYISDASSEHPAGSCYISDASSELQTSRTDPDVHSSLDLHEDMCVSMFSSDVLQECVSTVQSCLSQSEDSSSDDEGKLIIEL